MTKPTTKGSAFQGRLGAAIYSLSGLLFVAWIASGLLSSTELVFGAPVFFKLPIIFTCVLIGATLGYALSAGMWRSPSATIKGAGTVFSMCVFALLYGMIGLSLAERAASSIIFWVHDVETHLSVQPVRIIGTARGAKRYVELVGFGHIRFGISELDFQILTASARDTASVRYCLPVVTEHAGQFIRVQLPNVPRPSLQKHVNAIVECKTDTMPPTLIS